MTEENDIWLVSNAVIFIFFTILLFLTIFFGLKSVSNVAEVKAHWDQYRCSPRIMPFASLYGYNAGENFNFCMGEVFSIHAGDTISSFTSIISTFSGIIGKILGTVSSIRTMVASLGGGINVVFQNITDRISNFFFQLRISAIRIKSMMGRMYAIMFSMMYMGLSAITGLQSFTNTALFGFLDTFCFPPHTPILIQRNQTTIKTTVAEVEIGDILLPTQSRVTATFHIHSIGQAMVRFSKYEDFIVSTNHYISHNHQWIQAVKHPDAIPHSTWKSDIPLICFNTDNHKIPVGGYVFCDYDETSNGDFSTMRMIEAQINGLKKPHIHSYPFIEYSPALGLDIDIVMRNNTHKKVGELKIADELSTGSRITGIIEREVSEICETPYGRITPATCIWIPEKEKWIRLGQFTQVINLTAPLILRTFIVTPSCQLEIVNGPRIRDYMELCSPDAEKCYTELIHQMIEPQNG